MPMAHAAPSTKVIHFGIVACLLGCTSEAPTWAELDFDERIAFMTTEVEPTMREIFQARDAQRWASFGCETCHGFEPETRDYAMPQVLGALPLENTLEVAEMRNPEMTAFMLDDVFPVMAELVGEPKYNEQSEPNGFRCVRCHIVAE
jgi:hypothetical protein